MHTKKIRSKPLDKSESIFEYEARLKKEAIEIAKNFVHTKPVKYLLK
ncbi:hypothetical protein C8P67_103265 [Flavobacterium aquicola]|uniref:Uncharacterized protein n=1 Tax=Flavobacterium aquicola TaxID=1682742 RepID=A0A3E0EQ73_9FLAO|nr:hypothetical protein C8P67_103265 [Flavobacterium aquicola]